MMKDGTTKLADFGLSRRDEISDKTVGRARPKRKMTANIGRRDDMDHCLRWPADMPFAVVCVFVYIMCVQARLCTWHRS